MAYSDPSTRATAYIVEADDWNELVNDIKESAPAKAATAGYFIRVVGANEIEEADPTDGGKLDGDKLDIDFTPSNYTPDAGASEADDADDLSAHLKGIDDAIGAGISANTEAVTGSRTAAAGSGTQSITGITGTPQGFTILADDEGANRASWGFVDSNDTNYNMSRNASTPVYNIQGTNCVRISDGTNAMTAVGSLTADGCDLVWTKTASGIDVTFTILFITG